MNKICTYLRICVKLSLDKIKGLEIVETRVGILDKQVIFIALLYVGNRSPSPYREPPQLNRE